MKIIFIALSLLISGLANSKEVSPSIHELAKADFTNSLVNLAEREKKCSNVSTVLPSKALHATGLNNEQLRVALRYFYLKNNIVCTKTAVSEFVITLSVLNQVEIEQGMPTTPGASLPLTNWIYMLEAKQNFNKLPAKLKSELQKVDELNKPFDVMKSLEVLGL